MRLININSLYYFVLSLLLAVFGFAVRANFTGTWGGIRVTSLLSSLLGLRTIAILVRIFIGVAFAILASHETVELWAETKVELKCINSVQVVKIIGNVVCLFELLHDLVVI